MKTQFSYEIHTERFYGRDIVKQEIFISISDHPKMDNETLEYLSIEEVTTLRNMCNQILKEVSDETRRKKAE